MPASISYRKLVNGEPSYGHGQADFLTDVDAVAQAVLTRLKLFEGEWWADQQDGLPLWQRILGVGGSGKNSQAVSLLLQERILGAPFVTGLSNVQTGFNPNTRGFTFSCSVETQFGTIALTNMPTAMSAITSQNLPALAPALPATGGGTVAMQSYALSGNINGVNTTFVVIGGAVVPPSAHFLFLNGVKLAIGIGYTLAGNTFTLASPPKAASGDIPADTLELYF